MASPTILPFKLVPTKGTILYAMCRVRTYYTDAVYGDASCVICHYRYMCATMCILSWAWVLRRIRSATVATLLCISCHFMFWWQVAHVLQLYISVCWSRGFSLNCAYFAKYAHTCACVCLCVCVGCLTRRNICTVFNLCSGQGPIVDTCANIPQWWKRRLITSVYLQISDMASG